MPMKTFIKILFCIATSVQISTALAQSDSISDLPMFQNIISDPDENEPDNGVYYTNRKTSSDTKHRKNDNNPDDNIGEQLRILANLYSAGKYHEALRISETIRLNYKLSKEDNLYRQMHTIASLKDLEYNEEADSATMLFLQKYPFYKPANYDPSSFKENINNYYTMPQFSIYAGAGVISATPQLDTVHVITDTINKTPLYNSSQNGYIVQIGFEYHPLKFLSISIAPSFSHYKYSREIQRGKITKFYYEESDNMYTLPIHITASLWRKREIWVPAIYTGAKLKYITKAKYSAYTQTIGETKYTANFQTLDPNDKNRINYAILGGLKIFYNFGRITLFGDAGLSFDIKPFNNSDKNLNNSELVFDQMYVPDSFHMLETSFTLGVKVNLFYKTMARYGYGY